MASEGRYLHRELFLGDGSVLTMIVILAAFTIGVLSSSFLYSAFGLLQRLNNRKPSNAKGSMVPEELPKLPATVPKHVAVIMDGNRRYGRLKHADPLQGHWSGGQTLVDFIQWCMQDGIEVATVYAFSTENWNRDPGEINTLMSIFAKYAESLTIEASTRNVRVRILSTDFDKLPPKVRSSVLELERATAECSGFLVNICLSYGSKAEIVMACNAAVAEKQRNNARRQQSSVETILVSESSSVDETCRGSSNSAFTDSRRASNGSASQHTVRTASKINGASKSPPIKCKCKHRVCTCQMAGSSSSGANGSRHHSTHSPCDGTESEECSSLLLDEDTLSRHMCTADIPDPDILIRTSGEFRISNFLLWQMAYTEMFFVDKFWPEISHRDLRLVLQQFHDRQRRFGV